MAKKVMVSLVWMVLALIASYHVSHVSAITCKEAVVKIAVCQPFLTNKGGITAACCQGAQSLNQRLVTRDDRKLVCECFKKLAPSLGVDPARAKQLPGLCHINLGVSIDPNVDCNKV